MAVGVGTVIVLLLTGNLRESLCIEVVGLYKYIRAVLAPMLSVLLGIGLVDD